MANTPPVIYAVVNGAYLLPLDDAVILLHVLAKATLVNQTWKSDTPYKLAAGNKSTRLEALTIAQHAAIFLEEPA